MKLVTKQISTYSKFFALFLSSFSGLWMLGKALGTKFISFAINHFAVACSVTWPLNGSEAGGDLALIKTSLLLLCKSSCHSAGQAHLDDKTERSISKQCHLQPRCHSKPRSSSPCRELQNDLLSLFSAQRSK